MNDLELELHEEEEKTKGLTKLKNKVCVVYAFYLYFDKLKNPISILLFSNNSNSFFKYTRSLSPKTLPVPFLTLNL